MAFHQASPAYSPPGHRNRASLFLNDILYSKTGQMQWIHKVDLISLSLEFRRKLSQHQLRVCACFWAVCYRKPCLSSETGPDDLQSSTSAILWFWVSWVNLFSGNNKRSKSWMSGAPGQNKERALLCFFLTELWYWVKMLHSHLWDSWASHFLVWRLWPWIFQYFLPGSFEKC